VPFAFCWSLLRNARAAMGGDIIAIVSTSSCLTSSVSSNSRWNRRRHRDPPPLLSNAETLSNERPSPRPRQQKARAYSTTHSRAKCRRGLVDCG
jgi:hypothetical protein